MFPVNCDRIYDKKYILEDSQYYYTRQTDLVQIYDDYNSQNGFDNLGYSSTALADILEQNGIISKYMEGNKPRFGKKLPGHGNIRFIKIDKAKLRENASPV